MCVLLDESLFNLVFKFRILLFLRFLNVFCLFCSIIIVKFMWSWIRIFVLLAFMAGRRGRNMEIKKCV